MDRSHDADFDSNGAFFRGLRHFLLDELPLPSLLLQAYESDRPSFSRLSAYLGPEMTEKALDRIPRDQLKKVPSKPLWNSPSKGG